MTKKANTRKASRKRKMPAEARAYFIGMAQAKYQAEKSRLFDEYDYDRISRAEYDRQLKDAYEEMRETIRWAKGE